MLTDSEATCLLAQCWAGAWAARVRAGGRGWGWGVGRRCRARGLGLGRVCAGRRGEAVPGPGPGPRVCGRAGGWGGGAGPRAWAARMRANGGRQCQARGLGHACACSSTHTHTHSPHKARELGSVLQKLWSQVQRKVLSPELIHTRTQGRGWKGPRWQRAVGDRPSLTGRAHSRTSRREFAVRYSEALTISLPSAAKNSLCQDNLMCLL